MSLRQVSHTLECVRIYTLTPSKKTPGGAAEMVLSDTAQFCVLSLKHKVKCLYSGAPSKVNMGNVKENMQQPVEMGSYFMLKWKRCLHIWNLT